MRSRPGIALALALVFGAGCRDDGTTGAEVGSSREGCGEPGSHSVLIGMYSCACEAGYDWCDEDLDSFECCPAEAASESGDAGETGPDQTCGEDEIESVVCLADESGDPGASTVWACNGERWVEVPGYATFECLAQGKQFAYGCAPGPTFLCGYGPGNTCSTQTSSAICVDEDIIDTCVWGRRTIDRCSRLCAELEVFGAGFTGGACQLETDTEPASCVCN